jgi:AcrR family transcriptional regulator
MTATADLATPAGAATASRVYADTLERLYAGIAASFAEPTRAVAGMGRGQAAERRTRAATVADPEVIADLADAPELRAVEELRAWLHLTYEDVARAAGLSGPSLLHHWRQRYRTGSPVRPRASTVEQLWRVHALVRAIAEALEGAGHGYAVRLWFRRADDGVTPLELLLAGNVADVERRAARLLFDPAARVTPPWRTAAVEDDADLTPVSAPPAPTYEDSDFA